MYNRRQFTKLSAVGTASVILGNLHVEQAQAIEPISEDGIDWYNPEQWGIEGRGWDDTEVYYDRLPARMKGVVRDAVWNLSRHSAGMAVRFQTGSEDIKVRYRLKSPGLDMVHMPATGVSGVDLYGQVADGTFRWVNVARPGAQDVNVTLAAKIDAVADEAGREYMAYLPLYNGIEKIEFGVKSGSSFTPLTPRKEKPLFFYGTSIMHGACASRPGMAISSIIGRSLNLPAINLGFSGNGRLEMELVELIAEIDAAVYCLDCLPNLNAQWTEERAYPFISKLRSLRQDTPILMVEDRSFTNSQFHKHLRDRHAGNRKAFRAAFKRLNAEGLKGIHYLEGEGILGNDGEAATDGSHPNDLGMLRYAEAYLKSLKRIL